MVQGDKELRLEIESLRAILLAKAGDIEGREDEDEGLVRVFDRDELARCAKVICYSSPSSLT